MWYCLLGLFINGEVGYKQGNTQGQSRRFLSGARFKGGKIMAIKPVKVALIGSGAISYTYLNTMVNTFGILDLSLIHI